MGAYPREKDIERHKGFQFGTDPMEMSEFEKSLSRRERGERIAARVKYIAGLQGRDGGQCVRTIYDDQN